MGRAETKRKNCTQCNKSLKRIDWYYRNGKHFCNKSCFRSFTAKAKEGS